MTRTSGHLTLGLAPMEGVTDLATRLWYSQTASPDFQSTPFLRVTRTYPGRALPSGVLAELCELKGTVGYTLIPQLMAAEEDDFLRAAALVLDVSDHVDLNAGCPAPNAVGKGAGSSLLVTPERFGSFTERLTTALGPEKLSVKMRTGFHDATELPNLLGAIAHLPLKRLTLHGRTRADKYRGKARWDLIAAAAACLPYPVTASGDVVSAASLEALLSTATDIKRVIVGRGALRNPWLFEELRTGQPVTIDETVLVHALASYALLQTMGLEAPETLLAVGQSGLFREAAGRDGERWRHLYEQLARALFDHAPAPAELVLSRRALGRVKMLWSYWRSSLAAAFFQPTTLRAKTFGELLAGIAASGRAHGQDELRLEHQPRLDTLYSGQGNAEPTAEKRPQPLDECRAAVII